MKNLNEKALRQQLIQRYLDGETTIEEEQALAHFYLHNHGAIPADEEDVCQLVLATSHLADDFMPSVEKVEEFDRIMAKTSRNRRIGLWPWLAAACAAAILVIFLAPPRSKEDNTPQQFPTVQTQRQRQGERQDTPMTDTSEVMPKTFLAANPSPADASHLTDAEDDQSDLISVDSVFGVKSHPDPLAEYTALTEKLQRECNEVFQMMDNNY